MAFTIQTTSNRVTARLDAISSNVQDALKRVLTPIASALASDVQARTEAHIHTYGKFPGQLEENIQGGVSVKENKVIGYVRSSIPQIKVSSGNPPLLALVEFGHAMDSQRAKEIRNALKSLKRASQVTRLGQGAVDTLRATLQGQRCLAMRLLPVCHAPARPPR